jgi:aminopeptidase N
MPLIRWIALGLMLPSASAQTVQPPQAPLPAAPTQPRTIAPARPAEPTRANILRGAYGPYRANNDLLSYHLSLRVDPAAETISGHNTVRFRMLQDGNRIQLDLAAALTLEKILLGRESLRFTRDSGAVFIEFPRMLRTGQVFSIDVFYAGKPASSGRFGDFTFAKDPAGRPWIFTSDEDDGASTWWPSKDQWRDKPQDGMDLSIAVPNGLTDISNGRFVSRVDLHDGYTQWNWHVSYGINSYDVALNIGAYTHFSDLYRNPAYPPLTLDYYCLPEDLDRAKAQFAQAKGMLDAFEHYFGEYPFARDGYKLIQVPYAGMEHQSAVAYGNGFDNGYLHRDWTGVGISPRFDFIIVHESGHEWFGNAINAADRADMWIHEGWTTYLETLFVEFQYGRADALLYTSGLVPKVKNREPILSERGVNSTPPEDQYFKGALMLATLRSVLAAEHIADDARWFQLLHDFFAHFKYHTILTEDVIAWWNGQTKLDLTPFFNEYLRHAAIPCLELNFLPETGQVMYKWQAAEPGFAMPVEVGDPQHWLVLHPTLDWQILDTPLSKDQFQVATGLFYVNVSKT